MEKQEIIGLPCKIGDTMWGIRNYKGCKVAYQGIVSEMFFAPDMSLVIVVKRICRGRLGEKIFFTQAEAEQAIEMENRRKK